MLVKDNLTVPISSDQFRQNFENNNKVEMGSGSARVNPLIGFARELRDDVYDSLKEVVQECSSTANKTQANPTILEQLLSNVYIPYVPALHSPGWLLRYLVGPFNQGWAERLLGDVVAGLTVAFLLIPQVSIYLLSLSITTIIHGHTFNCHNRLAPYLFPFHRHYRMRPWRIFHQ